MEIGQERQGSGKTSVVCPRGVAAQRVDPAQTVLAAFDRDDLSQLQFSATVGNGPLRGCLASDGAEGRSARDSGGGGGQSQAAVSADWVTGLPFSVRRVESPTATGER